MWHKPRYSSGATNLQDLQPFWDDLYAAGVDILMDGHDHIYERFTPMKSGATLSSQPVADPTYGIQQFTVGMGGEEHHNFSGTILGTSLVRNNTDFGIFKLTLHADSYDYVFLPIAGSTFTDSGTGTVRAAPPISADYYVDNTDVGCTDSGAGSLAAPFCTIGKAASLLTAGQTVRVLAGTYAETVNGPNSGTAGYPITYSAAPGVTVTGNGTSSGNAFRMSAKSYIVIDGFTITDTVDYGIYAATSNHITISNNHVSSAGGPVSGSTRMGIFFTNTDDSTITGNTTDHNSQDGIRLTGGSAGNLVSDNVSFANAEEWERNATGIQVTGAGSDNNTLIHNITYANEDSGLQFYAGAQDNLAIGNLTYGNGDHGIDNNAAPGNTIVGNTVQGNVTAGINLEGSSSPGSGGATLANNIAVDNGLRLQSSGTASGQPTNIRVDAQSIAGTTLDYDVVDLSTATTGMIQWNGTTYSSLAAFQAAVPTQEVHGLEADPLFAAPAAIAVRPASAPFKVAVNVGDYHLTAGSPAIDSADADASNEPALDIEGQARVDDPATPNTGVGTRTYDDRGAYEFVPAAVTTFTLSGTVSLLATTDPVIGATVSAWDATTGFWTGAATTNGSGDYSINLPAGSYNLYIQGGGQPASWFGGTSKATATDIVVTTTTTQDIALGKAILNGTVSLLATTDPVSGATVSAWDATTGFWTGAATTNGSGDYSINLPAGSYNLYIQGGGQPASWFGGTSKATATDIVVTTTTTQDIALGKAILNGTVSLLATTDPVIGATVSAWDATTGFWTGAATTNGSGDYSINLPAGSYNLYIQGGGQPASWFGGTSKATATDIVVTTTTTQDIALGKAILNGTVSLLATTDPVSGATVSAWDATTGFWTGAAATNGSGDYSINLPAGSYNLYIQGGGQPASWFGGTSKATATDIVVTTTTTQDIALGKAIVKGTVTASGTPVSGATVSAWDATTGFWTGAATTNGSGDYSINLPAGSYNLYIQGGGQPASWFGGTSKATATDIVVTTTTTQDIAR